MAMDYGDGEAKGGGQDGELPKAPRLTPEQARQAAIDEGLTPEEAAGRVLGLAGVAELIARGRASRKAKAEE